MTAFVAVTDDPVSEQGRRPITASSRAAARWASIAVLLGIVANIVVVESVSQFPLEDATNNLARYVMLDQAWLGGAPGVPPPYITAHFVIGPYLGLDLIGAALVHLVGPAMALRIIAALVVAIIPIGTYCFLRAIGSGNGGWGLVGVLLGLGFFSFVGFINFVIGVGAAMLWLAWWWRVRSAPRGWRALGLSVTVPVLYLVHLSAPLIVLVVLWVDLLVSTLVTRRQRLDGALTSLGWRRAAGAWARNAVLDSRTRFVVAASLIVLALCIAGGVGAAPATKHAPAFEYPSFSRKVENLFTPYYVFSAAQALLMVVIYCGMFAAFVYANRELFTSRSPRVARIDRAGRATVALSILAFVALFLVFPAGTPGTGYLDMRWLPLAFVLPFGTAGIAGRVPSRGITSLMLAGCLLNATVLRRMLVPVEHELSDFRTAMADLPPGARVLPLIADRLRHGRRVFPYRHYAFWYVIERGGRVPLLFNGLGEGNGAPLHTFQRHFVEQDHLYYPGQTWGTEEFTPLDWRQIDRDYDYIIEAGTDPRATRAVAEGASPIVRVGDVTVFVVNNPAWRGTSAR